MRSAARTALLLVPPAALIAYGWARIEDPPAPGWTVLWVAALGCAPALLPRFRMRIAGAVVALLLVVHTALRVSVLDARPRDGTHDFFGPLASRFARGVGDYYDFVLPFDAQQHPYMHGVALLAIFAGCLSVGICVAAREPAPAALALLVWAAWPMTLLSGPGDLRNGALVLAGVLFLLSTVRPVPGRRGGLAVALVAALAVVALGVSTSPAVAKPEFLDWQTWDFYNRPDMPVSVAYVWSSSYTGVKFPKKVTTVFRVEGPDTPYYWRATTLDTFENDGWLEDLQGEVNRSVGRDVRLTNEFLPARASSPETWVQERVTMAALRESRLIAPATPVAIERGDVPGISFYPDGVAFAPGPLSRDQSYTTYSFAPQPTPKQLARSRPDYPARLEPFLKLDGGAAASPFGSRFPNRGNGSYEPLYSLAQEVTGNAASPYAATVAVEAWLRSNPKFTYNQQPEQGPAGVPPLVWFVTNGHEGYCQHYAGAMALMLRSLGIPARVAAGFVSGRYDVKRRTWTVTDHDAHTWVEVWFKGYGWLPFDPTPSRGGLGGTYTSSSLTFDLSTAGLSALAKRFGLTGFDTTSANGSPTDPRNPLNGIQADVPRKGDGAVATVLNGAKDNASLLRLLALIAVGALALVALLKTGLRWGRLATGDPRRVASACRRELTDFLVDQRIGVPRSATPHELSELVDRELGVDGTAFAEAVAAARFGPPGAARESAQRARRERKRMLRAVRGSLPVLRRARGLVSLRSLGVTR